VTSTRKLRLVPLSWSFKEKSGWFARTLKVDGNKLSTWSIKLKKKQTPHDSPNKNLKIDIITVICAPLHPCKLTILHKVNKLAIIVQQQLACIFIQRFDPTPVSSNLPTMINVKFQHSVFVKDRELCNNDRGDYNSLRRQLRQFSFYGIHVLIHRHLASTVEVRNQEIDFVCKDVVFGEIYEERFRRVPYLRRLSTDLVQTELMKKIRRQMLRFCFQIHQSQISSCWWDPCLCYSLGWHCLAKK